MKWMKRIKAQMQRDPRESMKDYDNFVYVVLETTNPKRIATGEILDTSRMRQLSKHGYRIKLLPLDENRES